MPARKTETTMTVCLGLWIQPVNGTLMARQGINGLAELLGSAWTELLSWGFGFERAKDNWSGEGNRTFMTTLEGCDYCMPTGTR
jgi:hypothetical protein